MSTASNIYEIGTPKDEIKVQISHKIIQLFSEGLYSSPNKAIEELVSNSYDAGAKNVHIILPADFNDTSASIVVIDDGEGMNADGLKNHWIIGASTRRNRDITETRKPIGKFGIGKLSTYVLASKLTHICKADGVFYAATMDYNLIPNDSNELGVFTKEHIPVPLRTLTEEEAKSAIAPWTQGKGAGFNALKLFGKNASASWTVAILSQLKGLSSKIRLGRLKWVLSTAMPQRNDFHLFLDGSRVESDKTDDPLQRYVLGKDEIRFPPPAPSNLVARIDEQQKLKEKSIHYYGLHDDSNLLGRITGYIEIFDKALDRGKETFGPSNGFFVYVNERLINVDDTGFGIERNLLRHGTFSRFRMVVHINSLDSYLRSSRESIEQGEAYNAARNFLRACFTFARNRLNDHDKRQSPTSRVSNSISSAPGSLTRKPLISLAQMILEQGISPYYFRFPSHFKIEEITESLNALFSPTADPDELFKTIELEDLNSSEGIGVYYVHERKLSINLSHPFVASFYDNFKRPMFAFPLQLMILSEILAEANMYAMGIDPSFVKDTVAVRDELLRQFVKTTRRRTSGMIALALLDARNDPNKLEEELQASFEALGFGNVTKIGGSGEPDGTAEAFLAADSSGVAQRYKIGLEAKSKGKVSAHRLDTGALERHMKDRGCDHHVVIGNDFATKDEEQSATVKQIKNIITNSESSGHRRTVTLLTIDDLARLIKISSTKRYGGLKKLRELFDTCITPEESKAWIDGIEKMEDTKWPYREILETIWSEANQDPNYNVKYPAVRVALRAKTKLTEQEIFECCKAMEYMTGGYVFAMENYVELNVAPDVALKAILLEIGGDIAHL